MTEALNVGSGLEANKPALERMEKIAMAIQELSLAYDRRASRELINEMTEERRRSLANADTVDLEAVVVCVLNEHIRRAETLYAFLLFPLGRASSES